MEDVVLLQDCRQVAPIRSEVLRSPHQHRYFILYLWRQLHGQAVHEDFVLAKRLSMVGNKDHGAVPLVHGAQGVDEAV